MSEGQPTTERSVKLTAFNNMVWRLHDSYERSHDFAPDSQERELIDQNITKTREGIFSMLDAIGPVDSPQRVLFLEDSLVQVMNEGFNKALAKLRSKLVSDIVETVGLLDPEKFI